MKNAEDQLMISPPALDEGRTTLAWTSLRTPNCRRTSVTARGADPGASHSKDTYLASQYLRLAGRRGRKRSLMAVGHSILVIFYHMLKAGTGYSELGGDFFDRLEPQRMTRYYVRRLESLGHQVTLESSTVA